MFDLDRLNSLGIKKNIDDDKLFLSVCDAIYMMCMAGDTSEYQNTIIKAIDRGYEKEVCYLVKEIWTYHMRLCEECRNR